MVALSHPCRKFPMEAAIATSTAPFIYSIQAPMESGSLQANSKPKPAAPKQREESRERCEV